MNCLIAGASGLVGQNLLSLLLEDASVSSVFVIARTSIPIQNPKLNLIISSFENLETLTLPSIDIAFCCLGTTIKQAGSRGEFYKVDHDYVLNFAKKSLKSGAKKFIFISALGADSSSSIFYSKVKGLVEEDLKILDFPYLALIRPSFLVGKRKEDRLAEKMAIHLISFLGPFMIGPLSKLRPVSVKEVALKMKELAFTNNMNSDVISSIIHHF